MQEDKKEYSQDEYDRHMIRHVKRYWLEYTTPKEIQELQEKLNELLKEYIKSDLPDPTIKKT